MDITPESLANIRSLYEQNLFLQAFHQAQGHGPLKTWRGAQTRLLGGRLAYNLGAQRLGATLILLAHREAPTNAEIHYFYALAVLERQGLLAGWTLVCEDLPEAPPGLQADWLALRAQVLGNLRDFDHAHQWMAQAEQLAPDSAWIKVERADLLEMEDSYPEALQSARQALALRPWYKPAVLATAQLLQVLDQEGEALDLLTEATAQIESYQVMAQLAELQTELGHYHDARYSYERLVDLMPLGEPDLMQWLTACRAHAHYYWGDHTQAAQLAQTLDQPHQKQFAQRLANPALRRVVLPVGFVRQHYMTCAPATLTTIGRYWSRAVDHLEMADEICYDGTPDHSERYWAETNGWMVREFTVTWESTCALIDRGVPFTLTTLEPTGGHLQAVFGYDEYQGALVIRDPYHRPLAEFIAESTLERYRATGPRGMALVPMAEAQRLSDLDLPDANLYDQRYRLQRLLLAHDREGAYQVYEAMVQAAPHHLLTLYSRRHLAQYDADETMLLTCTEKLLALFPDNPNLLLSKSAFLDNLARRDERLSFLQNLCSLSKTPPVFWQQYAQLLREDARYHDQAIALLRRALRYDPRNAMNYATLAHIYWDQRRFDEALRLYRFAACLEDKNEYFVCSYFTAARHQGKAERVLEFLRLRFERLGARSSGPARTLYWAYSELEQMDQALAVLGAALTLRPEDGDLLLYTAEAHFAQGAYNRAQDLLDRARGKTRQVDWLAKAAALASRQRALTTALDHWQQVLTAEPLDMQAQRAVAQLLAETQGPSYALKHLAEMTQRFPFHYGLHRLRYQWLSEEDMAQAEVVLRHMIAFDPADGWAQRELALVVGNQRRLEEAFAQAAVAADIDPNHPSTAMVQGRLYTLAGRVTEAIAAYRRAIQLAVDSDHAIRSWLNLLDTQAARREALAFIRQELIQQVIFGDGLLEYRLQARRVLDPEELLAALQEAHQARPDLWHAWSALIEQLVEMDRLTEALAVAQQGTEHFSLLPKLWLDRAEVHRVRGEAEAEVAALQRALQINPNWSKTVCRLAQAYESAGAFERSRDLMAQAVSRAPLDAIFRGYLADVLWRLGEREAALVQIEQAVHLDPDYEWAWEVFSDWSKSLGQLERVQALVRDLATRRSGEVRSWLLVARQLTAETDLPERLAALDYATALDPRHIQAYETRVQLLSAAGRYDEAYAACFPALWGEEPPARLRARAAWVEAERGASERAIDLMRAVVAEEPNFYWAWEKLADWYNEIGMEVCYLEAAQALVRIDPQEAVAWGYLGDARLRMKDRPAAKAAFARALELSPGYGFAGYCLFDEQLVDKELDAAAETLAVLMTQVGGAYVLARAVQLATRQGEQERALAALQELCFTEHKSLWPLKTATSALLQAGWVREAGNFYGTLLHCEGINPQMGSAWVRCLVQGKLWLACRRGLTQLLVGSEIWQKAIIAYIEASTKAKRARVLRPWIERYRETLRAYTQTWGIVGYALAAVYDYRATVDWLADWSSRSEVEAWMLVNLVEGLRASRRRAEAVQVSKTALQHEPGNANHRLWLAFDQTLTGVTGIEQTLSDLSLESLNGDYRFLYRLIHTLEAVQSASDSVYALRTARQRLHEAILDYPVLSSNPLLKKAYRQCLRTMIHFWRGGCLWIFCRRRGTHRRMLRKR